MVKLWSKGNKIHEEIEDFTVGNDYLLDKKLLKYDCLASIAHAKMLNMVNILSKEELNILVGGLNEILHNENFEIKKEDEDCHTAIENHLVQKYGEVGKKIHTARSRNDQVLTALRLYELFEMKEIKMLINSLVEALKKKIDDEGYIKIPGYTHMQKAMPSSVGMWLGSFHDAFKDELVSLQALFNKLDQSPLGSAAGFGVPLLKIDKKITAKEMGFSKVQKNPLYCQLSRGKFESEILNALTQLMFVLNKMSTDLLMFSMKEFSFVEIPSEFCTGSSIMPQKKNADFLELIRGYYSVILGEEMKVKSMIGNLMSGYNRDMQLTKEPLMKSIDIVKKCFKVMSLVIDSVKINEENCKKAMTDEIYATEEAYKLVKEGVSFRDAYKHIGKKYLEGD